MTVEYELELRIVYPEQSLRSYVGPLMQSLSISWHVATSSKRIVQTSVVDSWQYVRIVHI